MYKGFIDDGECPVETFWPVEGLEHNWEAFDSLVFKPYAGWGGGYIAIMSYFEFILQS